MAVEYAHRHLAEVGVCWQFPAEDPAVLEAEFAVLAAELGARDGGCAGSGGFGACGAGPTRTGWLLVFDNARTGRRWSGSCRPRGTGGC